MADQFPTIEVKADAVLAKLRILPERLRNRLRTTIPGVTRDLADKVRTKLAPGALGTSPRTGLPLFNTTNRLLPAVAARMVENVNAVKGRVFIDPAKFPSVAAMSLESGARPHTITARNASALFFFWPKVGANVAFKSVNHPGFPGAFFLRDSLAEQMPEIREALTAALTDEVRAA